MADRQALQTERLILRQWQDSDYDRFAALNADPEVMAYFPSTLSRADSDKLANRIRSTIAENGWGFWAVQEKGSGLFIGFVGLNRPQADLPFAPCVEVGWRLARPFWAMGYASEAAEKSLEYGFAQLNLKEIVSFTSTTNLRSQAVMTRLGMGDSHQNFEHPAVPVGSGLREHVLFRLSASQWRDRRQAR